MVQFQHAVYTTLPSLIAVTETWLNSQIGDSEILPKGYNIFRLDRTNGKRGGGILFASREDLSCASRPELSSGGEILFGELNLPAFPKIAVIIAYRPPTESDSFNSSKIFNRRYAMLNQMVLVMSYFLEISIFLELIGN